LHTFLVVLNNKEKSFQIILPSNDIIALRLFVFVSALSDKMLQQQSKVVLRSYIALLSAAYAEGGRQ